jgi:hypothetical protein
MEPGVSIESGSAIRVAVLPVGGPISPARLRDYAALVARHARVDLASLRPYYSEHQKSPFAHQPWGGGCLRLKFVLGGCVPSPWEDFQSSRKVLAVVGICHLPSSPDLGRVAADFVDAARSYPSALASRCFAFCPTDAQVPFATAAAAAAAASLPKPLDHVVVLVVRGSATTRELSWPFGCGVAILNTCTYGLRIG